MSSNLESRGGLGALDDIGRNLDVFLELVALVFLVLDLPSILRVICGGRPSESSTLPLEEGMRLLPILNLRGLLLSLLLLFGSSSGLLLFPRSGEAPFLLLLGELKIRFIVLLVLFMLELD